MSRLRSPVTPTKVKLAVQLAIRHRKLSAAISDMRKTNASHTPPACERPADRLSTRFLTPYCVPTEQATAATTADRITTCAARRWRRYRSTKGKGRCAYPERLSMTSANLLRVNGNPTEIFHARRRDAGANWFRGASPSLRNISAASAQAQIWWRQMASARRPCGRNVHAQIKGNFADAGTFPLRRAGAESGLRFLSMIRDRRRKDAHRAGCPVDGGCSTQTVRRDRTGRSLVDRGTGGVGTQRHAFRERRFPDLSET